VVLPLLEIWPRHARNRFSQQVAQSLGISVKSVFAMAWAISATVSAVAGVVVAVVNGVSAACRLRHQGVPGGDPRWSRQRRWCRARRHHHRLLENFAHFLDSEYLHWGNLYEIAPFYALIII